MQTIYHTLWLKGNKASVFEMLTSPPKLNIWWTLNCSGKPKLGEIYDLVFGQGYEWEAKVIRCKTNEAFSLEMTKADKDWINTKVHFDLEEEDGYTKIDFKHEGWPEVNPHFTRSSYCWAMYLRCIKRYLELGEIHTYEVRTNV